MTRTEIRNIIKDQFGNIARLNINPSHNGNKYYKYSVVWTSTNQGFIFGDTYKELARKIYD